MSVANRLCCHCRRRPVKCRKICALCYKDPAIRHQYPTATPYYGCDEPTEAELDALIEEQRKVLPSWWHTAEARQ